MSEQNQLEKLAKKIPPQFIGDNGRGMEAMDHTVVTQLLLLHLGPYSFEMVRELTGPTKKGEMMLTGVVARLTCTVDGREVRIEEAGGVENASMKDGDGERLKHAMSDALKRCAMRLGLGLHLWANTDKASHYFLDVALAKRREEATGNTAGGTKTPAQEVSGPDPEGLVEETSPEAGFDEEWPEESDDPSILVEQALQAWQLIDPEERPDWDAAEAFARRGKNEALIILRKLRGRAEEHPARVRQPAG